MSTVRITEPISVEDYLDGELISPVKHEYVAGAVFAMVGAKNAHNQIAVNTLLALGSRLKGMSCRPFNSDTKIRVKTSDHVRFYYPDVSVVCDANPLSDTFQDRPVLIVEVLSESTKDVDENEKLEEYLKIPSVDRYVLLRQDRAMAMVYARDGSSWRFDLLESNGTFDVPCLDLTIKLEDIYEGLFG